MYQNVKEILIIASVSHVLYLPYLPSLSWMAFYLQNERVKIEAHENFIKSTGRNRTLIAAANGVQQLSIPLLGGRDTHRLYRNTKISYAEKWQKNHWRSIVSAYHSSPFFEHYEHYFTAFYNKEYELLFDYNMQLLNVVLRCMKCQREPELTSQYEILAPENDYRNREVTLPMPRYQQVFEDRYGFVPQVSVLDLIFNKGPQALIYLKTPDTPA